MLSSEIIRKPIITEKSMLMAEELNKYTFSVDKRANKVQIRKAIEELFNVKVLSVNTLNRKGKTYRTRFGEGSRSDTKRAIVSLAQGDRIDIFNAPSA